MFTITRKWKLAFLRMPSGEPDTEKPPAFMVVEGVPCAAVYTGEVPVKFAAVEYSWPDLCALCRGSFDAAVIDPKPEWTHAFALPLDPLDEPALVPPGRRDP